MSPGRKRLAVSVLAGLVVLGGLGTIVAHAMRGAKSQMVPHRLAAGLPPAPAGDEPITFRTSDQLTIHGWLHRGSEPALVVLTHGQAQTRVDRLPEAQALQAKGFSTLVYDLRAHGESEGELSTFGDKERLDLAAAIDAGLAATHATRLGLLGFSIGGTATQEVATHDPRVNAVVLVAPDPDVETSLKSDFQHWGPLSQWPALYVASHHGVDLKAGHWATVLPLLVPKGLLLIVGDREFDMKMTSQMLAEARAAGAETLEIPGATHGSYAQVAPDLYPAKVAEFFVRRLISTH